MPNWSDDCFGVLHRWLLIFATTTSSVRSSSRSSKTFKPKKNIPEGTHQYDLMKHAAATLGSGNLRNAVALPDGEDPNEWVAVNSEYKRDNYPKDTTKKALHTIVVIVVGLELHVKYYLECEQSSRLFSLFTFYT